ncbi:hypothetical protein ABT160_30335 [Streptomyces sp. NPDC001941]|uniref:SCO4225 family membrane protein n=1 Tax=Streptomyces sp. NPDC001941 TaxID=3154659 RepID=UPI00332042B7
MITPVPASRPVLRWLRGAARTALWNPLSTPYLVVALLAILVAMGDGGSDAAGFLSLALALPVGPVLFRGADSLFPHGMSDGALMSAFVVAYLLNALLLGLLLRVLRSPHARAKGPVPHWHNPPHGDN